MPPAYIASTYSTACASSALAAAGPSRDGYPVGPNIEPTIGGRYLGIDYQVSRAGYWGGRNEQDILASCSGKICGSAAEFIGSITIRPKLFGRYAKEALGRRFGKIQRLR